MRAATLLVLLAAVLATAFTPALGLAPKQAAPAPRAGASAVELFVEGMAYGLAEEIGNITECMADIELTEQTAHQAMEDIRHGFKHLRPSYIEKGLRELGDALEDLTDAMIACACIGPRSGWGLLC